MIGARQGAMTGLRRLVAAAMSRDLCAFVVPGADVARAHGLDLAGAGLHLVATPRHASVLVIFGPLPAGLRDAASIAYAQMPRPRAILALGPVDVGPLPTPDAIGPLTQSGLVTALADLRRVLAEGSFRPEVQDYDAPALQTRTEFTCPMHPQIVSDEPGNCPICGMTLVPRETASASHTGHAMPGTDHPMPSEDPAHAMAARHDSSDHVVAEASAETAAQYTCPMHPEVISDEPGACPKCGMTLVPVAAQDEHGGHGDGGGGHGAHSGHGGGPEIEGIEANFMSMVDLTRDMPASPDGLKMEWIDVPFGPFFPGLPGGLRLDLILDGDAVAEAKAESQMGSGDLLPEAGMTPEAFVDRLAALSPLSPVAYRELACRALERAAGQSAAADTANARVAAVERERIASHLNWLAGFGAQTGCGWLEAGAGALQKALRTADMDEIARLAPRIATFLRRVHRTPLLHDKLSGVGRLTGGGALSGPAARASGEAVDARSDDPVLKALGFVVLTGAGDDALARLTQRTREITQSIDLISRVGAIEAPIPMEIGTASGNGDAVVETPRGAARLRLTMTDGKITAAEIGTPTAAHIALIGTVAEGRELGDALTAIGSLDISPWEMTA
ncbi:MAG: heavy metal-binding domain-containing protein [Jannaschia helgolandensis]